MKHAKRYPNEQHYTGRFSRTLKKGIAIEKTTPRQQRIGSQANVSLSFVKRLIERLNQGNA